MNARSRWRVGAVEPVELGTAELVPDPGRPAGWTLLVDGIAQSYVDLDDPTHLEFEYVRRIASVIDAAAPPGSPLRVLHLGGGGLTLPRYVAATRPGSRQRVVERDGALVSLVQRILPAPAGADLEIVISDARASVCRSQPATFDLVIADVYRGARMVPSVATTQFAAQVARVLRPAGQYLVNVTDRPQLIFSRRQVATLRESFGDVCVVGEPGVPPGRRFGNVVLAAALEPGGLPIARLVVSAAGRDPDRGRLLRGADLDRFVDGAHPMLDPRA